MNAIGCVNDQQRTSRPVGGQTARREPARDRLAAPRRAAAPLFTVRLESLLSRFFGGTAGKSRLLFDQITQARGVYLLDEFDAIGARRGDPNDVGEIGRVLNRCLPS